MALEWYQRDYAPSRFEANAEAAEERWLNSYEDRYTEWCSIRQLDPESIDSVRAFEDYYEELSEQEHYE